MNFNSKSLLALKHCDYNPNVYSRKQHQGHSKHIFETAFSNESNTQHVLVNNSQDYVLKINSAGYTYLVQTKLVTYWSVSSSVLDCKNAWLQIHCLNNVQINKYIFTASNK